MQASWRGEAVREVRAALALAPCSSSSLTQSKLLDEQASHRGVLPSTFLASTWEEIITGHRLKHQSTKVYFPVHLSRYSRKVTSVTNLSSGFQEQPDALSLSTDAGLVQGCDGVHSHNVDWSSALDEVLQLDGVTLRGCSVHVCSFWPATCRKKVTARNCLEYVKMTCCLCLRLKNCIQFCYVVICI